MKRITLLVIVSFISLHAAFAKQVDEATAKIVAQNFAMSNSSFAANKTNATFQLSYTSTNVNQTYASYFYIFNSSSGFVIVSGDDRAIPVLGYSNEGTFDSGKISPEVAAWFEGYKQQIDYIISKNISATDEINFQWQSLKSGTVAAAKTSGSSVAPLLSILWDQAPYYNQLCPFDRTYNERTVTGCVATAMAQIMKFWNYPSTGTGSHAYYSAKYGNLSADFSSTTYQWSSMPNQVKALNTSVATLMYQCGIAVGMNYGVAELDGSSAYVIAQDSAFCSENAYKNYFKYDAGTLKGIVRRIYTDNEWIALLENELNNGRPVQYAGYGSDGGHTWVCDGYDASNHFHMNWGWSGTSNGYFTINSLNPSALGVGGGSGNFNYNQQAIIGIQPPLSAQVFSLKLNDYVSPTPSNVNYGDKISISTNIINSGTNTFIGDYSAALYDTLGNFVCTLYTWSSLTLASQNDFTNGLSFSNAIPKSADPGNYYIQVLYRPTGGNWSEVPNNGSFKNNIPITILATGSISVYPNPATDNSTLDLSNFLGTTTQVSIFDMTGQEVMVIANIGNQKRWQLPVGQFANGVYFIQLKTSQGIKTEKLVVHN